MTPIRTKFDVNFVRLLASLDPVPQEFVSNSTKICTAIWTLTIGTFSLIFVVAVNYAIALF